MINYLQTPLGALFIIAVIVYIVLMSKRANEGKNRFGEKPIEAAIDSEQMIAYQKLVDRAPKHFRNGFNFENRVNAEKYWSWTAIYWHIFIIFFGAIVPILAIMIAKAAEISYAQANTYITVVNVLTAILALLAIIPAALNTGLRLFDAGKSGWHWLSLPSFAASAVFISSVNPRSVPALVMMIAFLAGSFVWLIYAFNALKSESKEPSRQTL